DLRHRGGVALPRAELEDPRVPARALRIAGPDLREELVHDVPVRHRLQHLAAGVHVATLRERDEVLREGPQGLRLRLGRAAPLVGEELRGERAQEQPFVRRPRTETGALLRSRHLVLPQGQPELVELALDLVDGLLAEVADVHQLGLALLTKVADRVDALAL